MSVVVQIPAGGEAKDRRLHLRDVAATPDGLSVGQILRGRREALGLDERAIASRLCIRRDLVVAIEAGDHARLPGRPYALGFIRSYALLLGLDAQDVITRFKAETKSQEALASPASMVFPDTVPRGAVRPYHLAGAAVMLAGVAYLVFQAFTAGPDAKKPAVVDAARSVTVVETAPARVDAVASAAALPAPTEPAPALAGTGPAVTVGSPAVDLASPGVVAVLPVPEAPARAAVRITLKANEASYVEVKDPALTGPDSVLIARELAEGESFDVPDRAGLVLLTGNAGGLQVAVDGRDAGLLGDRGQVIRRLVLDPAYFQSRTATSR